MSGWAAIASAAAEPIDRLAVAYADPAAQQSSWLLRLVAHNVDTRFGRRHGFGAIKTIEDYIERVPAAGYEQFADDIEAIADGAQGVLTADPIVAFEETSGSTAGRKLIPYTRAGLADIESAVLSWLHGLAEVHPGMTTGQAYWSVSPVGRPRARTRGGVPIGFASDAGYFSDETASALSSLAAVPLEFGGIDDIELWRFLTLRTLLSCDDLTFVSVWSPTFLSLLLDALPALADRLLGAIHDGVAGCDTPIAQGCAFRPQPERARDLARVIDPIDVSRIWPRLAVVSAWSHGPAGGAFEALRQRIANARFDGKGLLATEGVVSLSLPGRRYPIPALTSTFLEFLDADGRSSLVHELVSGATYRTVITTSSGLYRYDLGDQIICRGVESGIPELEFAGRAGLVADMVGEKLDEAFVAACLAGMAGHPILAPVAGPDPHYVLFRDASQHASSRLNELESNLARNPHYAYARRIGQLGPLRARPCPELRSAYHHWRLQQGQKFGDIKPPVLLRTVEETTQFLSLLPSVPYAAAPRLERRRTA
jgi:hypothetical protein